MKERIQQLLKETGLTATRLADEISVERSGISHILSGRNQPSYDFMIRLLNRYPDLSAEWLLTGKGPMLKSNFNSQDKPDSPSPGNESNDLFSHPATPLHTNVTPKTTTSKVTNVTTEKVIVLHSDGTFELYIGADKD